MATSDASLFQFASGPKQPNAAAVAELDRLGVAPNERWTAADAKRVEDFVNALLTKLGLQWVLNTVAVSGTLDESVIPIASAEQQANLTAFINNAVADLRQQFTALFEDGFIKRSLIATLLPEEEVELSTTLQPYLLQADFVTQLFGALTASLDARYALKDGSAPATTPPASLAAPTFTYVGTGYSQDSDGSLLIAADTQPGPNYAVVTGKIQLGTVVEFSIPTPSTLSESIRLWFLLDPANDGAAMQRVTIDPDHISIANAPLVAGDAFRISVLAGDNASVWRMLAEKSSDNGATWSTIDDNAFAFDATPHYLKVGSAAYANIKWYLPKVSGLQTT
jgi:hypothetical protein